MAKAASLKARALVRLACILASSALLFAPRPGIAQELEHLNLDAGGTARVAGDPFISSDGRYVVFVSSFLLASDTQANQVYLYDRETDVLELVSQAANGDNANSNCSLPDYPAARAVSESGRYVVFLCSATNLPGTANPANDDHIWIRDRTEGTTSLVSAKSDGTAANSDSGVSGDFSLAPDGWAVVFNSRANNLDDADGDNNTNTYLHQLSDRTTRLACINSEGVKINSCTEMTLSCTGGMAFISADDKTNLNDLNTGLDVFFGPPLGTGVNNHRILSVTAIGGSGGSIQHTAPAVSCDGTRIAFGSKAQLAINDTDTDWDLYVYDLSTSIAALVRGPSDTSLRPLEVAISSSGNQLGIETKAGIADSDADNFTDVYLAPYSDERVLGDISLISQRNGSKGNQNSFHPAVADNGAVAFRSSAPNLIPAGVGVGNDVLVNTAAVPVPPAPEPAFDPAVILLILNNGADDDSNP